MLDVPVQLVLGSPVHQSVQRRISGILGQKWVEATDVVDQHTDFAEAVDIAADAGQLIEDRSVLRTP